MAESLLTHTSLEQFLVAWYQEVLDARPEAIAHDVEVERVEPKKFPPKLLIIRDDGGPDVSFLTSEASVGFSVLAGTKSSPKPAWDLALLAHALLSQIAAPGDKTVPRNPVAALLESSRPVMVGEEQDRARVYFTATFSVTRVAL